MLFSVAKVTLQPQMSASLSVHSEAKPHHTYKLSCLSAIIPMLIINIIGSSKTALQVFQDMDITGV